MAKKGSAMKALKSYVEGSGKNPKLPAKSLTPKAKMTRKK